VDLARLSGCAPLGVICEIVNEDGSMSRTPELLAFAKKHSLLCITIDELIEYRARNVRPSTQTLLGVRRFAKGGRQSGTLGVSLRELGLEVARACTLWMSAVG
jgi:hypothetical protein